MRVENTGTSQRHIPIVDSHGNVKDFVIPRRFAGVNGACDIPDEVLAKAKKDPIVAHWFGSGDLKEVKPGFESKPPPPTESELIAQQAEAAARREESNRAELGQTLLENAQAQSMASKPAGAKK